MQICLWTQPTTVCVCVCVCVRACARACVCVRGARVCKVVDADLPVDTAGRLFSSSVGVGVLADSVQQTADTRLSVCRDLLILVSLTQRLGEQVHSHSLSVLCLDCLFQHFFFALLGWQSIVMTVFVCFFVCFFCH